MKILDQITISLRNKIGELHNVYIDVVDNPLSEKWLTSLNQVLKNNLHLEKNYHWMGFNERNLEYICNEINDCILQINCFDWQSRGITPYYINDSFAPELVVTSGEIGEYKPGYKLVHDKTNWLHRYFEDLQGHSKNISSYYRLADTRIKLCIRKLNLLCHELESFVLSERKRQYAPEWAQYNQLFCFLNAPRFKLDPKKDYDLFGVNTLHRSLGEVYIGVNKAVSKTHWEVFKDEGDTKIDELVTTALHPQIEASADFDISWSQSSRGHPWHQQEVNNFKNWLLTNGLDPNDPNLTIGNPLIAQVNLEKSFKTCDYGLIQHTLSQNLDVYKIVTNVATNYFDYRWDDKNYNETQISLLV